MQADGHSETTHSLETVFCLLLVLAARFSAQRYHPKLSTVNTALLQD
jgi:hypothetical protein